jgi:hypothetical protein
MGAGGGGDGVEVGEACVGAVAEREQVLPQGAHVH